MRLAGCAAAAGALAGLEFKSTTGVTADWLFAVVGADVGAGAVAAGAGVERLVTVLVVAVRMGAGAGLAATRADLVEVRLCVVVFATVGAGADSVALVSLAVGVVSAVVGGVASTVGGGLVVVVVVADGVGWTSCARRGVEESARAAAIAGRALVRAYRVVVVII